VISRYEDIPRVFDPEATKRETRHPKIVLPEAPMFHFIGGNPVLMLGNLCRLAICVPFLYFRLAYLEVRVV